MTLYGEGSYASSTNQESNLSQSSNGAENSFLRRGEIFRRSEGSGMLIGDPLSEGSSASSTNRRPITELWGAEYSLYRVRGTQTFSRERLAHRWSSIARGAMLARPSRRANYHRALRSGKLIPQNELRRSEGSGMLIGDPLSEGSNTSSTNSELWRAENSFERELKHSGVVPKAQAGAWPTQIRARSCARNPTLRDF